MKEKKRERKKQKKIRWRSNKTGNLRRCNKKNNIAKKNDEKHEKQQKRNKTYIFKFIIICSNLGRELYALACG